MFLLHAHCITHVFFPTRVLVLGFLFCIDLFSGIAFQFCLLLVEHALFGYQLDTTAVVVIVQFIFCCGRLDSV